jgi:hypothetical protein
MASSEGTALNQNKQSMISQMSCVVTVLTNTRRWPGEKIGADRSEPLPGTVKSELK